MQEMQQYNPAMWWPPLHNLRLPLLSTTSTDYCCAVQQKSFIQHKAKYKPPASTNTVFTTKTHTDNESESQKYREQDIIRKTAFEQNTANFKNCIKWLILAWQKQKNLNYFIYQNKQSEAEA